MHQPHPTVFQPATYICADCAVEHNGDVSALPQGWDRCIHPHTKRVTVSCPDCLERIEQDYVEFMATRGYWDLHRTVTNTATAIMGRAAAAYHGGLNA